MRRSSIFAPIALAACAGAAPPPVAAVEIPRVEAPKPPATKPPPRGACAPDPERAWSPPSDARTLVTAQPSRTIDLPTFAASKTWYGVHGGTTAPIDAIWAQGVEAIALEGKLLLRTADGGQSWDEGTAPIQARAIGGTLNDLYLAGGRTIAHSSDEGATWSVSEPLDLAASVYAFAIDGADLYVAGGRTAGGILLAHSNDHGQTWKDETLADVEDGWLYALAIAGDTVWVGGTQRGRTSSAVLARTDDCGATWTRVPAPTDGAGLSGKIGGICATPSRLVVASTYAIWTSADGGASWRQSVSVGAEVLALACRGEEIWAGGRNQSFLHSTNGGADWTRNELAPLFTQRSLSAVHAIAAPESGIVYAGGEGSYQRPSGSVFVRSR